MSNFVYADANELEKWSEEIFSEYVPTSGFMPYMGAKSTSIIRTDRKLSDAGAVIHFPYFRKLTGAGVTGGGTLFGNGDKLVNASVAVRVSQWRNSVEVPESQKFRSALDVMSFAKDALVNQAAERLRDDTVLTLQSIPIAGGLDVAGMPVEDTYTSYANASPAQRDAWTVANKDRILYGAKNSNGASGVHETALGLIDETQKLSAGVITMAKTLARKTSTYKINPYKSDATAGREYYVLFVDSNGFRDLMFDPTIMAANQYARDRGVDSNPIFQGGDLLYNGIIIREIPEMTVVGDAGANNTQIGHAVLAGVNTMALAWGQTPEARQQTFDYGELQGSAIREVRGQSKFSVGGVQTGCVSIFHASSDDA